MFLSFIFNEKKKKESEIHLSPYYQAIRGESRSLLYQEGGPHCPRRETLCLQSPPQGYP